MTNKLVTSGFPKILLQTSEMPALEELNDAFAKEKVCVCMCVYGRGGAS